MGVDEGQFIRRDIFFQKNRLVLRHGRKVPDARPHFIGIEMQALRNQVRVRAQIARRIAQEQGRERGIVIDDDAPFAVQNFAARREDGNVADPILLGQR